MHILIIDDHPLTCQGLASLLSSSVPGTSVQMAHTTADARAALSSAQPPDWLFLDIQLPDDPQRHFFTDLCTTPWVRQTVLMSGDVDHALLRTALGAGARGFMPKSADPAMVLAGFEAVRRGEVYLPAALSALLQSAPPEVHAGKTLSPRLRDVQMRILRGASNKAIAREFSISEHTVKEYVSSVLAYHGVGNRLALILKLQGGADSSAL